MFPLGSVLLPGTAMSLYLFEPRYLRFYDDVVLNDEAFGIVLIERGSEVGGGDRRFDVGTAARATTMRAGPVGRFVVASGSHRIRVDEWLDDDPYPRALVTDLPETAWTGGELIAACRERLATMTAILAELGIDTGEGLPEIDGDPVPAVYQIAQRSWLQPLDLQRLLEVDEAADRARLLREMLDDRISLIRLQLGRA